MMQTEIARQYQAKAQEGESPRTRKLALLDAYYHGRQYDFLPRAWDEVLDAGDQPVPFRSRRPSTVVPIPPLIVNVFKRALWGTGRRPKATIAGGSDDDNALIDDIIAEAKLYRVMSKATRRALTIGTGLIVWRIQGGRLVADPWDAKYARPVFQPGRFPELSSLDYRFKYTREEPDGTGGVKPVEYWHREVIDATTWRIYQEEPVTAREPEWQEDTALSTTHDLGFVPAVWFTVDEGDELDGCGVFEPFTGLIDELNYTASQMGRALYYNLDPQTVLSGVNEGDVDALLKGGKTAWFLPNEKGSAKLLESSGTYIEQAVTRIDTLRQSIFDAAGIVLPDPEKVKGAQSGTSLELLAAPQIARVDELREDVGDAFVRLLEQILVALNAPQMAPDKARIDVRDAKARKLTLESPRIVLSWGAHFPLTPSDSNTAADAANKANGAGAISRQAAARYLAPYFGVEDVEADQKLVEADENRQDKRVRDYDAIRDFRGGLDHLPPHLEPDDAAGGG